MNEYTIFLQAVKENTPAARAAVLETACAGDASLRRRVERLLAVHDRAGNFLEVAAFPLPTEDVPDSGREAGPEPDDLELGFLEAPRQPGALGRLGHYEVLDLVGRGGMGVVLRACDDKLRRVVAIKVLAPALAASAVNRQRFIREARAAAAVAHEHVVAIYAVEEEHRPPYLVMPFIEGVSLQGKLDEVGALGVRETLRIGLQVAEGLAAAHKQGLVHRDVKPANILLENGVERVKLTDFGLARSVDDVGMTQSGLIAGTPQYMSPEQADGRAVDHRSDLFSLGTVLYALCTGRPPFRGDTTLAVLRRVVETTPSPIRELNPEVPDGLAAIIDRLLAKDPGRRFQTAGEVADLLAGYLAHLQGPAQPDRLRAHPSEVESACPTRHSDAQGMKPWETRPHRHRLLGRRQWAAAAAVLLALAVGVGASEATGLTDLRGTFIRLVGPAGSLVIEVEDPAVAVTVDGQDVVITGAGAREIRLKPGQYQVTARKDGKIIQRDNVAVTRNGRPVVRVTREEPAAVASREILVELDRLVHLAQQKVERLGALKKQGGVSAGELLEAEIELVEVKARRAVAKSDIKEHENVLRELVALREQGLDVVRRLYQRQSIARVELDDAEKALHEARLRLKEAQAARVEPRPAAGTGRRLP
jgi:serine/threonine protein kinase